mgnify:CR=1 FL=1
MIIPDYPMYDVSSDGEVTNIKTGRILKPDPNRTGYLRVTLSKEGKTKRFFVHRLVALVHIPNPRCVEEVNHKNGIKTDNRKDNLEWCSSSENKRHAVENGLGVGSNKNYMSSEHARAICVLLSEGSVMTHRQIADVFNVSYNAVCLIKTRKTWTHISKDYDF